jgi:hypothetical protein
MKTPEQFLSAMRDRYGISEDFVLAGRPLVGAIYAEFDGKQRADLLDFAESVFAQQAATERAVRVSTRCLSEAAGRLERALGDFRRGLETLRQAVAQRLPVERPVLARWQLN